MKKEEADASSFLQKKAMQTHIGLSVICMAKKKRVSLCLFPMVSKNDEKSNGKDRKEITRQTGSIRDGLSSK
ncbi:MAG: hypothetical protein Q3995_06390 [Eubacteriales bacterium]|nr:hypothetical protein [Eubacteriales bacterium]